jgi:hypothetical protein
VISTAASPPTSAAPSDAPIAGEACPLCGAPLHPDQEWCLRCGAAARTRLAASPNWKMPIAVVLVLLALSLGVLAAALVKLAGDSGPARPASTTTVTSAAATTPTVATTAPPATSVPSTGAPTATAPPIATTPGATTSVPGVGRSGKGTTVPRTSTGKGRLFGLGGVSRALEERLRRQATQRAAGGK